jgi:hypothetical protein
MLEEKIRRALKDYDPYGFRQVVAAQSAFVVVGLFLIHFAYALPNFNQVMLMPAWGLIAIGRQVGFNARLRHLAIFFFICVVYACLLTSVQSYHYLTVITVGVVIASLFMLSKNRPYLLFMIPFVELVAHGFFIVPEGGSGYKIFVFILNCFAVSTCALVLLYAFPRIYFFRVWLRAWQATLQEFSEKILEIRAGEAHLTHQQMTTHLAPMEEFARSLSLKEYGFSARKLSLRCINLYTFLTAAFYQVQAVTAEDLLEIANFCSELVASITAYQPIKRLQLTPSSDEQIRILHRKLGRMVSEWNRLCQRL